MTREPAETVAFERVGAGEVDGEVSIRCFERRLQSSFERVQELGVVGAVGEGRVEVALLLVEGEILRAVDREREHRRVPPQYLRCTVPLVHVGVDDDHPRREARGLDGPRGDGGVVEDAVTLAPVRESVVRPAREVRGESFLQGGEAGAEGTAGGAAGALHHPLRPREADAPDLLVRK